MKVFSAGQVAAFERRAAAIGISPLVLMENAAVNLCSAVVTRFGGPVMPRTVILCGRGNNGGDGMALARHLHNRRIPVSVMLIGGERPLTAEAERNRRIIESMKLHVRELIRLDGAAQKELAAATLIVDALFGTGLSRPVAGVAGRLIEYVNTLPVPVVAVDLPSGIHADSGAVLGRAVRAMMTVALGCVKPGHLLFPGRDHAGEIHVADISLPREFCENGAGADWLRPEEMAAMLPYRRLNTHKGSYGHVGVVGGSPGKTGAACMTALAVLKAGAGLVTLFCASSLNKVCEKKLLEAMTRPVADKDGYLTGDAVAGILEGASSMDAVVIGPGLSTHAPQEQLFRRLLRGLKIPVVIDADGLNLLARHPEAARSLPAAVLTPHPGEMARLAGVPVSEVQSRPVEAAAAFARRYDVTVVLKGATTVIASPDGRTAFSTCGNPGMATAGSGDVLAGVIGAFLGQGYCPRDAAALGVVTHGCAGDAARLEKGERGLTAADIIAALPRTLKKWEEAQ